MENLFNEEMWNSPEEFKDLSSYKYIAIDLETKDPNLKKMGSGSVRGDGEIMYCLLNIVLFSFPRMSTDIFYSVTFCKKQLVLIYKLSWLNFKILVVISLNLFVQ